MNSPIKMEPRLVLRYELPGMDIALFEGPDLLVAKPYQVYTKYDHATFGEGKSIFDFSSQVEAKKYMHGKLKEWGLMTSPSLVPNFFYEAIGSLARGVSAAS